jgi:lysophospholipase L1-like esterase
MRVLVMGDSYSAGNGAGDYSGAAGCYRSSRDYAQDFAAILRKEHSQPTTVTDVACDGATTADFSHSQGSQPPQFSQVNASYNLIFLTIGGNDVNFESIVANCLIAGLRKASSCASALSYAAKLLANGTMRSRLTNVLAGIRARANPRAKIVLIGYPFMEGDTNFTLSAGKTVVKVGKLLHAIGVTADALGASVVKTLNAKTPGKPFVFISVHKLFDGPPYHGLYASKVNPKRWMIEPFVDATTAHYEIWYHPDPTGWLKEAKLLAATPSIPRHPANLPS